MAMTLMMSAQMASTGLLEIKFFWNKIYDFTISAHDVNNNIFSRDSNHTADAVMWLMFGDSSISMREVIITSIL